MYGMEMAFLFENLNFHFKVKKVYCVEVKKCLHYFKKLLYYTHTNALK